MAGLTAYEEAGLARTMGAGGAARVSAAVALAAGGDPGADPANVAISTVGAGTLTAASIVGGLITRTGSTAAYTDTTATAALIVAAVSGAVAGQSWYLVIKNTVGFNETIAAGSGVTLTGQTIVPPNSVGVFLVTLTSLTAVSIRGVGVYGMTKLPLEANTAITTVGAGTLSAAGIVGRLITRSGSTAAYSDATDTAANIIAALPNANIGDSFEFTVKNTVAFAETITAGTGVTLAGLVVVPPLSVGRFLVKLDSLTAVTITGISMAPLCNLPASKYATAALATGTLTAGQITGAQHVFLETTTDGAASMTTRTGAEMLGDIPNCSSGFSYMLTLINSGNNTLTLLAGANVTLTGTMTVATTTTRTFVVTFTSATAVTIQGVNVGTIEAT